MLTTTQNPHLLQLCCVCIYVCVYVYIYIYIYNWAMRLQRLRTSKTCSQQAGDPQERMVGSSSLNLSLKAKNSAQP